MSAAVCNQARSLLGRRCALLHVRVVPLVVLLLLRLGLRKLLAYPCKSACNHRSKPVDNVHLMSCVSKADCAGGSTDTLKIRNGRRVRDLNDLARLREEKSDAAAQELSKSNNTDGNDELMRGWLMDGCVICLRSMSALWRRKWREM